MAYKSHKASSSRFFDCLYDPLFICSGEKDIWRKSVTALDVSAPTRILTVYNSMFTDLQNTNRKTYWKSQNPLPHFPFKTDRGYDSTTPYNHRKVNPLSVEGQGRSKYFYYPPIHMKNYALDTKPERPPCEMTVRKLQTIGCQTVYRESSAQTRPFMPEILVTEGSTPELALIADLIKGDQQPGEFEAKVIERARKRRQLEQALPSMRLKKDWEKQRLILEAFEWEEWMAREDEIQECQNLRFQIVQKLVENREKNFEESLLKKIDTATKRIEKYRKKNMLSIQNKQARALRKVEMKHKKISSKYQKSEVLSDILGHATPIRFGPKRKFKHVLSCGEKLEVSLEDSDRTPWIPFVVKCSNSKNDRLSQPKEPIKEIKRGFRTDKQLKILYESLRSLRERKFASKHRPKSLEKMTAALKIAPSISIGIDEDITIEKEYQSAVYLEKMIKGRAVQNILLDGKLKCRHFIEEIQSSHRIASSASCIFPGLSAEMKRRPIKIPRPREQNVENSFETSEIDEVFQVASSLVGSVLDFLEKELEHLQEQRKIQALSMLAEQERQKREAEYKKRREYDEARCKSNQATSDMVTVYLESVLHEEIDVATEIENRKHIEKLARRIDMKACNANRNTIAENEFQIQDMIEDYIFPEVKKRLDRREKEMQEQSRLNVAHKVLYENIEFRTEPSSLEQEEAANAVLNNLIYKIIRSEDVLSELATDNNMVVHETLAATKEVIQRIFSENLIKTGEKTIAAEINEIIETPVRLKRKSRTQLVRQERISEENQHEWLKSIIDDINIKLWDYAIEDIDDETVQRMTNSDSNKSVPHELAKPPTSQQVRSVINVSDEFVTSCQRPKETGFNEETYVTLRSDEDIKKK